MQGSMNDCNPDVMRLERKMRDATNMPDWTDTSEYKIAASIEQIKQGALFADGRGVMIKLQDILPSGIPACYLRFTHDGKPVGDFNVNAVYLSHGGVACCPYNMKIFAVRSEDDLYDEKMAELAHTTRHIPLNKGN